MMSAAAIAVLLAVPSAEAGHEVPRSKLDHFFALYCNDCHAEGADEGGFALEELGNDLSDAATFARWERIADRVALGEMPPKDAGSVPGKHMGIFHGLLDPPLHGMHAAEKGTVYRRLNRREYENTMNDLFGTNLDLVSRLPEDGRSHEFDNVGEALGLSMVHLQQYIDAADAVMEAATETSETAPEQKTKTASYAETSEGKKFIGQFWKKLPDGSVAFFQRMGYPSGMLRGSEVRPPGRYRIRVTGYAYRSEEPITIRVGGTSFQRGSPKLTHGYVSLPPGSPDGEPATVELEADIPERYMIEIDPWGIDTGSYNLRKQGVDDYKGPGIAIKQVELIGPLREFPRRGHRLLFDEFERVVTKPAKGNNPAQFELRTDNPDAAVQRTLLGIAERAFRRPVERYDIGRYIDLVEEQRKLGASGEEALKTAIAAMLCSPDFLFFNETETADGRLTDHALASRLAYFLTRSLPDEELRADADAGQLAGNPAALLGHTSRLLADPRGERFITDFTDAWLNLRDIEFTAPDNQLFPEFDQYLQYSMMQETQAFVRVLINENLPVTNIVRSDFAMLNDRLAEHYGIDGVSGPELRKVPLPRDSVRGGLLSQASILKVSANGTNTSPVVRGVWVMERILGDPPQPPPPGIPGVEPDIRGATTLRELLDKHRDLDSCRACHAKIDPPGFALECFNPIGGYRERFRSLGEGERVNVQIAGRNVRYKLGPEVDDSGELPDGTRFKDYRAFRNQLAAQPRPLAIAFVGKLLTFATGRELGYSDRPLVEAIVDATAADGYRVRDLLEQAVLSPIFNEK